MSDTNRPWLSSRKATNQLLLVLIAVLTTGFVSLGGDEFYNIRIIADRFLMILFFGLFVTALGYLLFTEP
ncbi:hypothetical protein [Natronolimnobius baerhuensis]|uniref:Uncharacterized protein n=1 Tax=Natronolimnobius baerhuensis TaxID=253108 RepID=A0A202E5Q5_9EURY|nr:hypothetical protein [Natronolimnobius baerhuensis]OVE83567.1 hypothetical protein B2G88_14100 [Natronolimnobius baerhuensis]